MKEIEMIADHLVDGSIRPIRFRIIENEQINVVKIERLIHENKLKDKNEYKCEVIINEIKRVVILLFKKDSTTWYLKD